MTLARLREAINFANRSRDVSGHPISEHFPDSHQYGALMSSGHFGRLQRDESDSTTVTDDQTKVRKTVKHYRKEKKPPHPQESEDDSTSEEPEPTPKVSKKQDHEGPVEGRQVR